MFDEFMGLGTSVYILWGIGALGLLLKLAANIHMKRMIYIFMFQRELLIKMDLRLV